MKSAKEIAAGWLVDPEPDQLEALAKDVQTIQLYAYRTGLLRSAEIFRLERDKYAGHPWTLDRANSILKAIELEATKESHE